MRYPVANVQRIVDVLHFLSHEVIALGGDVERESRRISPKNNKCSISDRMVCDIVGLNIQLAGRKSATSVLGVVKIDA